MLKFIIQLICLGIYPFSFLAPRSRNKWAFGSYRGLFNDNTKYMFIELSRTHPEIDACWFSSKRATVRQIREMGLKARWILSPSGVWHALRSKHWVVNAYTQDIMFCLSGNATVINLWHGIGLKKCEFNITTGPLAKRYVEKTLFERITHPECFRKPDYLLTVSDFQTPMFAKAFRLPESRCLKFGYPRNSIVLESEERRREFITKYESKAVANLIKTLQGYDKVYIYMPTWRESQRNLFAQAFDLEKMNSLMSSRNSLLLLKPHANTIIDRSVLDGYSNVRLAEGITDTYPILPYCDVLITDYSSILYDFIIKEDAEVILYLYDYTEYRESRDFFYPFDDNVIGSRAYDFDSLCDIIQKGEHKLDNDDRKRLINRFWGESDCMNVCEDIINSIR